ncbi:hypothetical protein ACGFNU_30735 [Spirillospora sp. NPDC048911]|uniref:hypothetical protein n=1 Tax=Spirillospora sp. NPDC048911 TaxID=3364527 RepID=UPI0037159AC9
MITNRHRARVLTAAASGLAALALLSTACGGDSGTGGQDESGAGAASSGTTGAGGDRVPSTDQQLKLAKCMRQNGVDMPDPKPGGGAPALTIGGRGASAEKIEKALKTCRGVAGIPEPKPLSQEEKDRMLKFARCMREHGVDMPDPKFSGNGGMASARRAPESGAEKEKFDKANKACGSAFG